MLDLLKGSVSGWDLALQLLWQPPQHPPQDRSAFLESHVIHGSNSHFTYLVTLTPPELLSRGLQLFLQNELVVIVLLLSPWDMGHGTWEPLDRM